MKSLILTIVVMCTGLYAGALEKSEKTIIFDQNKKMVIVVADALTSPEQTAHKELENYLQIIKGEKFSVVTESEFKGEAPAIYLGHTSFADQHGIDFSKLGDEEWIIKTVDGSLILTGGRPRGTLYSVYRFLEDKVGVRWWTPYAEFVPSMKELAFKDIDLRGKPAFSYRDIYFIPDGEAFKARNRVSVENSKKYGGQIFFGGTTKGGGSPACHTLYTFMEDVRNSYKEHPEWFPLIDGERKFDSLHANARAQTQLCLTNPELREYFVQRIRSFIKEDFEKAAKRGVQPPIFYAIDQNDCYDGFCKCENCMAVIKREDAVSGLMVEFVNHLASNLKNDAPNVIFLMMAQHVLEKPPKLIKMLPNVGLRLCDTTSNMIQPWSSSENTKHRQNIEAWSEVTDKIVIWDYQITYGSKLTSQGLPFPSTRTFAPDLKYLAEHSGIGVFFEHEDVIGGDLRELKVWLELKLAENPYLDYALLLKEFTDGYYGAAGAKIRDYISFLESCADKSKASITYFPTLGSYAYLNYDFILPANKIFDEAMEEVKSDPVIRGRISAARLSLDRATLLLVSALKRSWKRKGGRAEDFPLDDKKILSRFEATWLAKCGQIKHVATNAQEQKTLAEILDGFSNRKELPVPERFKSVPKDELFDFNAFMFSKWIKFYEIVPDADSVVGSAYKVSIADVFKVNHKAYQVEKYRIPFEWAVWPTMNGTIRGKTEVERPLKAGYNWYKAGSDIELTDKSMLGWHAGIGMSLKGVIEDNQELGQKYDLWINMKFTGPDYSAEGLPGAENSIYVDRVIVIQKTRNADKQ